MEHPTIAAMIRRATELEDEFPVDSVWRHYNGRLYVILGVANIANFNEKCPPLIVYRSQLPTPHAVLPSRLWTKSIPEFREKLKRVDKV